MHRRPDTHTPTIVRIWVPVYIQPECIESHQNCKCGDGFCMLWFRLIRQPLQGWSRRRRPRLAQHMCWTWAPALACWQSWRQRLEPTVWLPVTFTTACVVWHARCGYPVIPSPYEEWNKTEVMHTSVDTCMTPCVTSYVCCCQHAIPMFNKGN